MSDVDTKRKQLIYNSWHRGVREADLIFGPFASIYVPDFSPLHLNQFEHLLDQPDSHLLDWIYNKEEIPNEFKTDVMQMILSFVSKEETPNPTILS